MHHLKLILFFFILSSVNSSCNHSHNKENNSAITQSQKTDSTTSFHGNFFGVTPCADCPGIETTVSFNSDSLFIESLKYQERNSSFSDTGRWSISDSLITVSLSKGGADRYFLLKNDSSVAMLDAYKKEISGPLAGFFILKRKE